MATALLSGEVLTRRTVSFKSRDGEQVTYHEAVVFDPIAKDFTCVRSKDKALLEPFAPGLALDALEVTMRPEPGNIRANLVKPVTEGAAGAGSDW